MEEDQNEKENSPIGTPPQRPQKIRDILTDRVIGIVTGALIPVVLLLIPLINKYLDNSKEIQTLQIQNGAKEMMRIHSLTESLLDCQAQLKRLSEDLTVCRGVK